MVLIHAYKGRVGGLKQRPARSKYKRGRVPWKSLQRRAYVPRNVANYRTGGFLGRELKFNGNERTVTLVSTVSGSECDPTATGHLCGIAQGTTERQRIGRTCLIKSIHIKGHVTWPSSTTVQAQMAYARFWLIQDTQTNGAQFNAEDVLLEPALSSLGVDAFQNLQYSDRFKVLKVITVMRPTAANTSWNGSAHVTALSEAPLVIYHKCNTKVEFSNTSSNVSDITNNSFHLIGISANISPLPSITYRCRVRFMG